MANDERLDLIYSVAKRRGGRCLSSSYSAKNMEFVCKDGHQFSAPADKIRSGRWCRLCGNKNKGSRRKNTIETFQKIAASKGGRLVSTEYKGAMIKHSWECAKGHHWTALPIHIKKGHWCPYCAGVARGTIEKCKNLAADNNGLCLSKHYTNAREKMKWECDHGHIFEMRFNNVANGQWCPQCRSKKKLTIKDAKTIAAKRGGKCLSKSVRNSKGKLKWECKNGHRWEAQLSNVKNLNAWCPVCAAKEKGLNSRFSIEEMNLVAKSRGGLCISKDYENTQRSLEWKCSEGHKFKAAPAHVLRGSWCPQCSSGLYERIVRAHFEQLFGYAFPKFRPSWLRNSRGNWMELDGYSEKLKLGFEYQGIQHFKKNYFVPTSKLLKERQADDRSKMRLCIKNGVTLIQVPTIPDKLELKDLSKFIKRNLLDGRMKRKVAWDKKIELSTAYSPGKLIAIQKAALSKGGRLMSDHYVGIRGKYTFECKYGHSFKSIGYNVLKGGAWCPYCSGKIGTLDQMKDLAAKRGGQCLSTKYIDSTRPLKWRCGSGHTWLATASTIKKGSWCRECWRLGLFKSHKSKI